MNAEGWIESLSQAALAFLGGLIGTLMRREASTWQMALLRASGAAFAGLLMGKACKSIGVSPDMTTVFVGVAGWLGASRTIDYIGQLLERYFGVRLQRTDAPDTKDIK